MAPSKHFIRVNEQELDGNYVVLDESRDKIFRSGCASKGMYSRWKSHINASKRNTITNLKSTFYETYPSREAVNQPDDTLIKGNFEDLVQLVGIGFKTDKQKRVVELFEWSDKEVFELDKLNLTVDNQDLEYKKYKHIAYLCEFAYALAISPKDNISGNPGFEWQLKWYGR